MVILAIIAVVKVYSGSRSTFAFVLMSLTALLGICYVVYAFDDAFVKEIKLQDGAQVNLPNLYLLFVTVFFIYVAYL